MSPTLSRLKKHCSEEFSELSRLIFIGPLEIIDIPDQVDLKFGMVFLDGGKEHQVCLPPSYRKAPSVSLGDGDSLHQLTEETLDFQFSPEKDTSDLGLAFQAVPEHISELIGLGLMGGDLSHQLANMGEIFNLLQKHPGPLKVELHGHKLRLIGINQDHYSMVIQGRFSVFSLAEIDFQITGQCRYNCSESFVLKPLSSRGLSNIGFGKVNFKADRPYFIIIDE